MAPAKRKRTTRTQSDTPRKKRKRTSDAEQEDEFDSQEYYSIKDILKETKTHYLIDWNGIDPKTKKNYVPTWEPKEFANELAVTVWEEAKGEGLVKNPVIPLRGIPPEVGESSNRNSTKSRVRPRRSRASLRESRVGESSSPAATGQDTASADPPAQTVSTQGPNPNSSPLFVSADHVADIGEIRPLSVLLTRQTTEVRISRPSDFDSDQYEQFPELPATPAKEQAAPASTDSSTGLQNNTGPVIKDGVVPDSQSLGGSSNYVLTTQSGSKPETSTATGEITPKSVQAGTTSLPEPYNGDSPSALAAEGIHTSSSYAQRANSIPLSSPALAGAATAKSTGAQCSTSADLSIEGKGSCDNELDKNTVSAADPLDQSTPSAAAFTPQLASELPYFKVDNIGPDTELIQPEKEPSNVYPVLNGSTGAAETLPQVPTSDSQRSIPSEFRGNNNLVNLSQDAQIISVIESSGDQHGFESSQAVVEPSQAGPETVAQQTVNSPSVDTSSSEQTTQSRSSSQEKLPSKRAVPDANIASAAPDHNLLYPPLHSTQYSTLGTDAPPRPATPADMPSTPNAILTPSQRSPPGASGLGENLKKMRAEEAVKRYALLQEVSEAEDDEQGGHASHVGSARISLEPPNEGPSTRSITESPDVIPVNVAEPAPSPEEIRTSERLPTLVPEVLDLPVVPAHDETPKTGDAVILPGVIQGTHGRSMWFVVALPAVAMTADQYKQTISYNRKLVQEFTAKALSPQLPLTDQARKLMERLENILTHVDLDNDSTLTQQTQQEIIPEEQVKWDFTCSTKFRFMHYLIEELRQHDKHVVIFAKAGKTMDITETFLRGHHVQYHRPEGSLVANQSVSDGKLVVTLLSNEAECSAALSRPADMIIALDNALDEKTGQIQELSSQAPVICLVVIYSPEHIKRCIPPLVDEANTLAVLVDCVTKLRNMVGNLPGSFPSPKTSAVEVAQFLIEARGPCSWTLPELARIPGLEHLVETYNDAKFSTPNGVEAEPGKTKRSLGPDDAPAEPTKKLRMTPQADIISSAEPDVTRISDTVCQTTQGQDGMNRLEQELETLRMRLKEKEEAFDDVQTEYEDISRKFRNQMAARAGSSLLVEESNRRLQALAAKVGEARDNNESLRIQAAEWQALARSSTVPEKVEMERVRSEARKVDEENKKLKASLRTLQSEFDFIRDQYQTASSAAAENASLLDTSRTEIEVLKRKASGETVRLHQILAEQNIKKYQDEIEYLKQVLLDREALLNIKEEEIKLLKGRNVGVGTRATSLPRSPRVGMTGSRQPSPNPGSGYRRADGAADGRLHPLRIS